MDRWDRIYRQIAVCESKAGITPGEGFQSVEDFSARMLDYSTGWLIPKNPKTWNSFDLNTMFVVPTEVRDLFYGHRTCSLSSFEGYRHYFPSVESYEAWLWTLKSRGHYARVRDMPKYWEVPLGPRVTSSGIEDSGATPTPPSEPVKPGPRTVKDGVGPNDLK